MVLWEWTPAQHEAWETWLASRPTDIQALARQFPPNRLYLLKTTGHRVTIYSYGEAADGHHTLTVNVTNEHNLLLAFERQDLSGISLEAQPLSDLAALGFSRVSSPFFA